MPVSDQIATIAAKFGPDFRRPTNVEISLLAYINLLKGSATAGDLVHAMVLATGKGVTYNQATLPLKNLMKAGLVSVRKTKAEGSGRMVDAYSLTKFGENLLELAHETHALLVEAKAKGQASVEPESPAEATKPRTAQELALEALEGRLGRKQTAAEEQTPSKPTRVAAKTSRRSSTKRSRK